MYGASSPAGTCRSGRANPIASAFVSTASAQRIERTRIGQGERIVAPHVSANSPVETVPGEVAGEAQVRDAVRVQVELRSRAVRLRALWKPGARRPDRLGEVGPAEPEEQADLDRQQRLDGDRRTPRCWSRMR